MKKAGKFTFTFLLVIAGAFVAVWAYSTFFDKTDVITIKEEQAVKYAALPADGESVLPDLTFAAENSIHAVVHIATQSVRGGGWSSGNPFFDEFFGLRRNQQPQLAQGFGSGVILSDDGLIVTNNHVIENAQNILVILNDKREFEARLVGSDPSTDIALLKIEAENMPYLTYGNPDELRLGEWVLAVGNPFNLTSTVTAGIVSALGRNLRINEDQYSIEAFIQTDAAVNPGNSGGALVNQQGKLIGINTAIASRTGSYTGYSFAVPVSIVRKVVTDLKEFGEVQRALLGVTIGDVDAKIAEELKLEKVEGVYVGSATENGAAKEAGIKKGDVIINVGSDKVMNMAELQEKVSQYRPGDDVKIIVIRNGEKKQFTVTLRNRHGDTQIVRDNITVLGAEFETINKNDKKNLDIENGIKIKNLKKGKLKDAGIKEGFIITNVNKKPIYEVNDLKREIGNARGGILVEGVYSNGELAYFVFGVE
ncbi:MAG: Do family serine endopeptidase [Prolixibacteraceae bacterium]|jgi:serine protease Do|nr:Do family serine endopeptidase [Prolixibacteraceae bacterium]MBT6766171.1 Do family serine endopeptidase [Prolixibacteraceae bacterium]MBT6999493.1 Do family serine endopeptidase [Prolixibacteraceae bacterium]MBT7395883.1 Do family serine endopeptidase [Prolixibacteraceae bacterium]